MFWPLPSEDDKRDVTGRRVIRAYGALRRVIWLARRAIIAAKLRRPWGELICHASVSAGGSATPVVDAGRWPQRPLILGDKWDF